MAKAFRATTPILLQGRIRSLREGTATKPGLCSCPPLLLCVMLCSAMLRGAQPFMPGLYTRFQPSLLGDAVLLEVLFFLTWPLSICIWPGIQVVRAKYCLRCCPFSPGGLLPVLGRGVRDPMYASVSVHQNEVSSAWCFGKGDTDSCGNPSRGVPHTMIRCPVLPSWLPRWALVSLICRYP